MLGKYFLISIYVSPTQFLTSFNSFIFFREAADAGGFKEEDEKPFACPFHNCSKSFRTQSKLTQHVRSHTGEVQAS